ncbi:MAG: ATP-binding protein [Candidatus Izemoplasmatales bacterium]
MEKRILIPNAENLIESMRNIGYKFETAVADIIDNSIFAKAKNIYINFNAFAKKPYLIIFDDGIGMNEDELEKAMTYGNKNPKEKREKNDLGRFGLGLKSASISQCRKLIVITKKVEINAYSWDLDYIEETKEWSAIKYSKSEINHFKYTEIEQLNKMKSGTIVLWENFDRFSESKENFEDEFLKKIEILTEHISLVFHRFLGNNTNPLSIFLNTRPVMPIDPFLIGNRATQKKPTQILDIYGEKVLVQPYILPHLNKISKSEIAALGGIDNLRSSQGYYVYRNKRLIIWGKWFGQYSKNELQKLVRIMVDIPNSLDDLWEIDIKKSTAVLPYIIRKNLGLTIKNVLNDGKRVFYYRGKRQNEELDLKYIWDRIDNRGKVYYKINIEHPIIKQFLLKIEDAINVTRFLELIEDFLPVQMIYNDHADNKNIVNLDKSVKTYETAKILLSCFSYQEQEEILTNPSRLEGLNIDKEILEKLKEEFLNVSK